MKKSIAMAAMLVFLCMPLKTQMIKADTVSVLIDRVRRGIAETASNSRFSNAEIMDMLTQGTQVVSAIVGGVETQYKTALVAKQTDYALPTSAYAVHGVAIVKDVNYIPLFRVSISNLGTVPTGEDDRRPTYPIQYAVFDDTVKLYPVQDKYAADTLWVYYFAVPGDLDSTSQITELPAWTDELVVDYVVQLCGVRDWTVAEWQIWWHTYMSKIDAHMQRIRPYEEPVAPEPVIQP